MPRPTHTRIPRAHLSTAFSVWYATPRSAHCVLDRCFEALCVEGRHTLDPPQTLGGVPDGEREHRLRIRGIDDVDEIVIALRVVDRLYLDAQFVELCLGLPDSLRLLACVLRAQISKQHIFHGHLHVMWIVLREDHAIIRLLATGAHAVSPLPGSPHHGRSRLCCGALERDWHKADIPRCLLFVRLGVKRTWARVCANKRPRHRSRKARRTWSCSGLVKYEMTVRS